MMFICDCDPDRSCSDREPQIDDRRCNQDGAVHDDAGDQRNLIDQPLQLSQRPAEDVEGQDQRREYRRGQYAEFP